MTSFVALALEWHTVLADRRVAVPSVPGVPPGWDEKTRQA